jgi:nitrogenase molybdenum-iron protein alpha chain
MGNGLNELYGVPYVRTINPMGVTGFETWLRAIGKTINKSEEVESYLAEQRAIYLPQIEEEKKALKGLRAVIGMGPGYTYEIARVLQELGIEVVWAAAWHYDYKYDNGDVPPALNYLLDNSPNNIKLSVADQQNYEVLNILNEYKPDLYFSRHPGSTVWAVKQGISAVYVADEYMAFGYEGTLRLIKAIKDAITNRSFEQNLAKRTKLPYTDWWYTQNNDKFLKEVKNNG